MLCRSNPDLVKRFELDAPLNKCALGQNWLSLYAL